MGTEGTGGREGLVPKKSWECAVCGKPSHSALMHVGPYCSELCKRELMKRDEEEKEKLLAEPVDVIPDELDLADFERYTLKTALHMIKTLPPKEKIRWKKNMPLLLVPAELAMAIKEKAIPHIPLDYISSMEAEGHERFFHGGTYQFKKKVPKEVVLNALIKGGVFKRPPEAGDV
jgi:hypothetical protein